VIIKKLSACQIPFSYHPPSGYRLHLTPARSSQPSAHVALIPHIDSGKRKTLYFDEEPLNGMPELN
jgi:hypothetical protein